jgi:hypothetical protein
MMTTFATSTRCMALATSFALLAACGAGDRSPADATSSDEPRSALGSVVKRATDEARDKLATENISVSHGMHMADDESRRHDRDLPDAEISPAGTLLIDGQPVPATPAQTALLLDYRRQIVGIAESGMDIGVQGADLAAKAMGEAVKGVFSGKSEAEIERSIESEADGIERAAMTLCKRLPALLASQRRLAEAMPEFAPYATMDESDVDDCMKDHEVGDRGDRRSARRGEVRDAVREGIRDTVRSTLRSTVGAGDRGSRDAAAEADAAGAEAPPAR